jgi:hypothetical protein
METQESWVKSMQIALGRIAHEKGFNPIFTSTIRISIGMIRIESIQGVLFRIVEEGEEGWLARGENRRRRLGRVGSRLFSLASGF